MYIVPRPLSVVLGDLLPALIMLPIETQKSFKKM
jgi:hypothetical protein